MRGLIRDPRVRASFALLVAAAVLAGVSLRRAFQLDPLPAARAVGGPDALPEVAPRAPYPPEYLIVAVRSDPFSPDRRPAPAYLLPGEALPPLPDSLAAEAPAPYAPPLPSFRLVGTMVVPGGRAAALLQESGAAPRIVRLGERIGTHTLSRVEPGRAVLISAGGERMELRVAKPGN